MSIDLSFYPPEIVRNAAWNESHEITRMKQFAASKTSSVNAKGFNDPPETFPGKMIRI